MRTKAEKPSSRDVSETSVSALTASNRHATENQLSFDAQLVDQITESALDAFVVMDDAGRVILWNRQSERVFGWKRGEILGRKLAEMVIPERFRQSHRLGLERLRETGRAKVLNRRLEVTALRKSGEEFFAEITIQALPNDGRPVFSAFVREISERKMIATVLRGSESNVWSLDENSPLGIYIHRNFKPLFVNQTYCRMLGYASAAEFMQIVTSLEETFAPYERERLHGMVKRQMRGKDVPLEYEYDSLCRDGTVKTLRNHACAIDWAGKPAIQATLLDVTEMARSSAALGLINRITGLIVHSDDPEKAVEMVLEEICKGTGWALGEAWVPDSAGTILKRGESWHDNDPVLRRFAEDSLQFTFRRGEGLPGRVWETCQPEWITDLSNTREGDFLRKDVAAKAGLKSACAVPVMDQRRVVMVTTFFTTERHAADPHWLNVLYASVASLGSLLQRLFAEEQLKRYEEIIAATPDFLSFVDNEYRIRAVSAAYAREFKKRRSDFIGNPVADLFGQKIFDEIQKPRLDRCLEGEHIRYQRWHEFPRSGKRWMDIHYTPYRDGSGAITGVLVAGRDLTGLRQAENRLRESRKVLRSLAAKLEEVREEERTEVAREVHDELGQKLTAVRLDLSELMRQAGGADAQRPEQLRGTLDLVDQLLEDVRRLSARLRPAILDELGLEDAITWLGHDFARRLGWQLTLDVDVEGVPKDGKTNTTVFRVLQEALNNAALHAGAKKVSISIYPRRQRMFMEVSDDGRGIRERQVKRVGSLGILGMRERAAALGGRVQVMGEEGKGTRVRLWLPIPAKRQGSK